MQHDLKTAVATDLCIILILATFLTFYVMMAFWLKNAALSCAKEKELAVALLIEQSSKQVHTNAGKVTLLPAMVATIVRQSHAVAGCALTPGEDAFCAGGAGQTQDELQQLITLARRSSATERSLTGLVWMGVIPGKRYLDLAVHLPDQDQVPGIVAFRWSLDAVYARLRAEQRYILLYLSVNFLLLMVVGFFRFRRGIVQPIEKLIRLTDSYSDEDGVPFLAMQGGDELGQLASSLQQMLGRIRSDREQLRKHVATLEQANRQLVKTREEMIRTEKLSSVGRLAAGLAHEIGNPLGIVQGYLGLIRREDLQGDERQDFCQRAEQELQRISRLVRQLLDLARPASEGREEVDLHRVIAEVVILLQPQPLMDGIVLVSRLAAEQAMVLGNFSQLLQVFLNCLINAADSIHASQGPEQGRITIETKSLVQDSTYIIQVRIGDNGTGLAAETANHALEPFYTTKEPGKGTGLGLSVSHALVTAMGGTISLANTDEGPGAAVTLTLPLVEQGVCPPEL